MVEVSGLANEWPAEGPKKLWSRELGDGYSTVVADGDKLYTMYRVGEDEFSVCLDAKTGKTVWEHKNPSPFTAEMAEFGPGPHATPLIVGNRVYTVGTNMVLHCLDKSSGSVIWKHDLAQEYNANVPGRGYSSSPIAYKDTVIVPVGWKKPEPAEEKKEGESPSGNAAEPVNPRQALMAFKQSDGSVAWKNQEFDITHSSPILIQYDGEDQLVVFMAREVAGLNPSNGELLWLHPHATMYGANLSTPLWSGDDLIFVSSAYDSGSRVIQLTRDSGKTAPKELWFSKKMRIHHANAVRIGDYLFGSSGDFGPAFFMGVNIKTGQIAWRERGLAKATCLHADGKLIILDEDGQLVLARATPEKFTILSKCEVAQRTSWAAPTLVGKTLYVRDRKTITALDLG
jgi:outer membrane protein assembly factor BamB